MRRLHLPRPHGTYRLTPDLVDAHASGGVVCLSLRGIGRSYRLHDRYPGVSLNVPVRRADLPAGANHIIETVEPKSPLVMVRISGPIEQRAGFYPGSDACSGGYSDGHDAIADRLCAAFAEGDVLLVIDSPGGAHAGLQQGVARAQKAKADHGRRCTVYADEMIGSAATWWAMALADEMFGPPASQFGSIGARGAHDSVAGAMAQAGVERTYFTWPNDGKVAFAPERPLSAEGQRRGDRDVAIAGEAFCAAVIGSVVGQRYGLTRDAIVALGADMLTGEAAVAAGLADGIASLDEVKEYALKLAEGGSGNEETMSLKARTEDERKADDKRAEDPEKKPGEPEPTPAERKADKYECKSCKAANDDDAKFCDKCGSPMHEDEDEDRRADDDADPDEPPPSSKKPDHHPPPPERMAASASIAAVLGLPEGASVVAQKTAAIDMRQVFDHAARLTGHRTAAGIVTELSRISADAGNGARYKRERDAERVSTQRAERWALADRLLRANAPGWERGKIYEDIIDANGKRRLDGKGNPMLRLRPAIAEMRLGTLRDMVTDYERAAKPRSPFTENRAEAERRADAARGSNSDGPVTFTDADRKTLESHPTIAKMEARGSHLTLPQLVAGLVATDPKGARAWLASQNGANP